MGEIGLLLGGVAALVLVPAGYLWLGRRARRRGLGHSVMAPLEEIWDPTSHRTNVEIHVLAEREAPAPAPGDRPHKITTR